MKKIICLVVPTLVIAVSCFAQERAPELPSLAEFNAQRAEADRAGNLVIPTPAASPVDSKECPALNLGKIVLTPPVVSSGWGVNESVAVEGQKVGKLEGNYPGHTFTFRDSSGNTIAAAAVADSNGLRIADISDCQGRLIGKVLDKSLSRDVESFEVQDAQGKTLASSGQVPNYNDNITLADASGKEVSNLHIGESIFSPKSSLDAGSLDPRLVLMVDAMKEYANVRHYARESQRHHGGR